MPLDWADINSLADPANATIIPMFAQRVSFVGISDSDGKSVCNIFEPWSTGAQPVSRMRAEGLNYLVG